MYNSDWGLADQNPCPYYAPLHPCSIPIQSDSPQLSLLLIISSKPTTTTATAKSTDWMDGGRVDGRRTDVRPCRLIDDRITNSILWEYNQPREFGNLQSELIYTAVLLLAPPSAPSSCGLTVFVGRVFNVASEEMLNG